MRRVLAQLLLCALVGSAIAVSAQTAASSTPKARKAPKAPPAPSVASQLKTMSDAIDAQQKQIEALRQEVQSRDQAVQQLQQRLDQSQAAASQVQAKADSASAEASKQEQSVTALRSDVDDLKQNAGTTALTLQETQKNVKEAIESPTAIHYKGITLTPGGFVAAETVTRQRTTSADINTPFTGIPYPGNALSRVAENNFTARQSRLTLLAEGKVGSAKLTGYYEGDFLGTGVTSNNRQSNSYVFRQRQIYAQAAFDSGWSFTGGQMWTLATENRKGIQNRQEALPMQIDPQYVVGFTWARQYGFRVVKDFGGKFALALSIEGPQATIGGRGFSLVTTTTVGSASVATSGNTFVDAPGAGGGLYNFVDTSGYTVNKAPDLIVKAALDPGWGHYEVFGILSTFRNRVYPCGVVGTNANDTAPPATPTQIACPINGSFSPSAIGAFNDTRTGGGVGASLRVPLFAKKLEVVAKGVGGDGIGRYGSAQLADLTFRPDGTQALIRTGHGYGGLELHPTKKLDIYAYWGAEYASRAAYQGYNSITVTKTPAIPVTATSPAIPATTTTAFKLNQIGGYGNRLANNSGCSTELPPSNQLTPSGGGTCAGDIRVIQEGTIGFWHKVYQGPKGGVRWGIQYSYFEKNGWSGSNNTALVVAPKAVDNMFWTSFRYYLP
jgi:TolA-binding protein